MNRRYISKANVQENDALVWDGLGPFLAYGLKLGYKIPKNLIFAPEFLKIHPSIHTQLEKTTISSAGKKLMLCNFLHSFLTF